VCYLDFDFGSPTAGAIFNVESVLRGTVHGGLHSYLLGNVAEPQHVDVWGESDRTSLREYPAGAGRLVLFPGDAGGGEFGMDRQVGKRVVELFLRLEEEFDVTLVDLSAGRSYATDIALAATAAPELGSVTCRWLIFHRWTRQHIVAAAGLLYGERGILDSGEARGHSRERLAEAIRLVRTAIVDPDAQSLSGLRPAQVAWLRDCNHELQRLASRLGLGRTMLLGAVPLDPVLQWREQLLSDNDVLVRQIANRETVEAYETLAMRLTDDSAWEGL
jgi:hypothetical protein